jgi:hypothetical protein
MNSKRVPHLYLNSFEAICYSSFENIAHIREIGRKIAAEKIQNDEIITPKSSPFKEKSIE